MTDVREFDIVRLTGTAGNGKRYVDLRGTVGTVKDGWLKVWPDSGQGLSAEDEFYGKLWFEVAKLESLEVIEREVQT